MSRVLLKSYTIPNINYDVFLLDDDMKEINFKITVGTTVSTKDKIDNQMQIDIIAYIDNDAPFLELSAIGKFDISDEMLDEDIADYNEILKDEGAPQLYEQLRKSYKEIVLSAKVPLPDLPHVEFN